MFVCLLFRYSRSSRARSHRCFGHTTSVKKRKVGHGPELEVELPLEERRNSSQVKSSRMTANMTTLKINNLALRKKVELSQSGAVPCSSFGSTLSRFRSVPYKNLGDDCLKILINLQRMLISA